MPHYIWQNTDWTKFSWREEKLLNILSSTRFKQGELIAKIAALHSDESLESQADILTSETMKTALIEGEVYDLATVRSSVNRKLGLSFAGLPETKRHIEGLVDVLLEATTSFDQKLTKKKLCAWHAALFPTSYSGLMKIRTGQYRNDSEGQMKIISGLIGREIIHFQAPPAAQLENVMKDYFQWWNSSQTQVDGLIRSGIAHFYFVTIHPFEDGNGRIARALTDMALAQDDGLKKRYYSLSEQIVADKKQYYEALEVTQRGDSDLTDWLVWFLQCFNQALSKSNALLQKTFAKSEFWKTHQGKNLHDRQRKVINKLLDAGEDGFQGGLTTRKYVSMTKTSRATAGREISDLVQKGILVQTKSAGRNVSYQIYVNPQCD